MKAHLHAPSPLLAGLERDHAAAKRRIGTRYSMSQLAKTGFKKPTFGSQLYYDFLAKGYISSEEADADQLEHDIRAARTGQQKAPHSTDAGQMALPFTIRKNTPLRWAKESPIPSNQYAPNMATTAARDERLTPNAKALLTVLHARCAKTGVTETTKGTLANIFNRSTRTIQRYLQDLITFGYISADIRRSGRGLYTGLVIRIQNLTKPFYEDLNATTDIVVHALRDQLASMLGKPSFSEETIVSPKKQSFILENKDRRNYPPPR